ALSWTSSSTASARVSAAFTKASSVFSGENARAPRWAMTIIGPPAPASGRDHRLAVGVEHHDLAQAERAHRRLDLRKVAHHHPGQRAGVDHARRLGHLG